MKYSIVYTDYSKKDLKELDNSQAILVRKAIDKVSENPLPNTEGGYGKPLGNNLTGYLKIKLLKSGIRIVYRIQKKDRQMTIIVIAARNDNEVYEIAENRIN